MVTVITHNTHSLLPLLLEQGARLSGIAHSFGLCHGLSGAGLVFVILRSVQL